jgi:hypothetical protein
LKQIKDFCDLTLIVETLILGYADSRITYYYYETPQDQASFKIHPGRIGTFDKQLLVYDANDMIGSIGGSLGLFLGFSFFGIVSNCLDKLLGLGERIHQGRNQVMVV